MPFRKLFNLLVFSLLLTGLAPLLLFAGHAVSLAIACLFLALLALFFAFRISVPLHRSLQALQHGVDLFSQGRLDYRLPVSDQEKTASLAIALNAMADSLETQRQSLSHQESRQEAVLGSMVEGVLVLDREERLLSLNKAAEHLLKLSASQVLGRSLPEAIRNSQLQQLVARTLSGNGPVEGDIILAGEEERFFQAHGTLLRDSSGQIMGALVVLNDVTRLRRLENIRREFVANVSHELKTPITLIQGFAETLLDGPVKKPDDARRFLEIMAKQTERLNAIIEDLLTLSRIEQEAERGQISLAWSPLRDVLLNALALCAGMAESKKIKLEMICLPDLRARVNARLLEQAVINLIDNAIKYSESNNTVRVEASSTPEEAVIAVQDHGCGIEAEHLPRLFERFYRVDKARSRQVGGSGLGLAIVKHIAQAHGGSASVESLPAKGSTFFIHLPLDS